MKKLILLSVFCIVLSCSKNETTSENQAPGNFTVSLLVSDNTSVLSWTESVDPEGDQVTYDIILSSENLVSNLTVTDYQIENLAYNTSYEGSVIAKDSKGLISTSSFSFTIGDETNINPSVVLLSTPEDNAIIKGMEIMLSWEPPSNIENNATKYDVFVNYNGFDQFGNDFVTFAQDITETEIAFNTTLGIDAQINWYVIATDINGVTTTSDTFNFRTTEETIITNWGQDPPFASRQNHGLIWFNDKFYIIGGGIGGNGFNDVWVSANGRTWEELNSGAKFTPRFEHDVVVFKNKIWVIGGRNSFFSGSELNDVWSSSDGDTWVQESANTSFPPKYAHKVLTYDNQLWLIGGRNINDNISKQEVWKSVDGINWTLVTNNADFSNGNSFAAIVFKNRMWKIAGGNSTVYSSTDGENWNLENSVAAFGERLKHSVTLFDDKLWLVSGSKPTKNAPEEDVWYSTDGVEWVLSNENLGYAVNNARTIAYNSGQATSSSGILITGGTGINSTTIPNEVKIIIPEKFQN